MAEIDERLTAVEEGRVDELKDNKSTFKDMANKSDAAYDAQISGIDSWKTQQEKAQQEQTDLAIEKLEQEREWSRQDYQKEQSGAYKDWQKQSNPYGANAESMAAQGMANTGYSESSQVAMYNQYQSRVAIARQAFERSNTEFAIAMEQARAQNSAVLAEIAFNAWKEKSTLAIQKVVSNQAIWQNWLTQQNAINTRYDNKYATVLNQINQENALAETKRRNQAQESVSERSIALQERQFQWEKEKYNNSQSGGKINKTSGNDSGNDKKDTGDSKGDWIAKKLGWIDDENSSDKKELNTAPALDSILSLGYGPISPKKLDELIRSGEVQEFERDGKLYYRRVFKP